MSKFDDANFFQQYLELRKKPNSYNDLLEQPAIKSLLPDVKCKAVLDLGCGFGGNCLDFVKMGAVEVLGIDISQKMLELAAKENAHDRIKYRLMAMEEINAITTTYDLVFSSLAIHYAADFPKLVRDVHNLLNPGGVFLFSQEHPLCTAPIAGPQWLKGKNGTKIAGYVSDYLDSGQRRIKWLDEEIVKYHRCFSDIVNVLTGNRFVLEKIIEPKPTAEVLAAAAHMYDEIHRPTAIVFKAVKPKVVSCQSNLKEH